ncbi:Gfo/Idh/MocA family oxidoreductase [Helicobacter pullorum]
MYKIAIIGGGQLGSRYLQGFLKSDLELSIEIVEPNQIAVENCKVRMGEVDYNQNNKRVRFFKQISEISSLVDMAVISTASNVRAEVTQQLLQQKKVKNLVLEKVLFQKEQEYEIIEKCLEKEKVNCWVNHPRRMLSFYQKIREEIKGCSNIALSVVGGNWGVGCNALHFLDLFEFLTRDKVQSIDCSQLDQIMYESKRNGFYEFNGAICGKSPKGIFSLISIKENSPVSLSIVTEKFNLIVDETNGLFKKIGGGGGQNRARNLFLIGGI